MFKNTPKSNQNSPTRAKSGLIMTSLKLILPVLVIGGGIGGFITMNKMKAKPETKKEAPRAVPVTTMIASAQDVRLAVKSQGEVRPRSTINLSAQVGGQIDYIAANFIKGGKFSKGDVLLKIQSIDYDLRLTQAKANVAQAQTNLIREKSESDIARADWDDLGRGGVPSALTLRQPQMAEAQAALASAQANQQIAQLALSRTIIKAPFDGRILSRDYSVGEYIGPNQTIGQAFATDIADIELSLSDQDLSVLGLGIGYSASKNHPAPLVDLSTSIAGITHHWQAKLVRISPNFDPKTRTIIGHAVVHHPYGSGADHRAGVKASPTPNMSTPLANGLYVNATIDGPTTQQTITIARAALRGHDQVYVAKSDNTLSIQTVTVLSSTKSQVVLSAGIEDGTRVITSPIRGVANGMKIEISDHNTALLAIQTTPSPPTAD